MNRRPMVYVAGPYTKGDVALNVRAAILTADALWKAGCTPFVPHLSHFWHMLCPGPYEQWTEYDLEFLPFCDALLRIPGESSGADHEADVARGAGIPVYFNVERCVEALLVSATRATGEQQP